MKSILIALSLIASMSYNALAQTPDIPEKNIYRSEDNKLYINKDLGVYIWLSTSPDTNSEKHRLISDSSSRYSNPMYFDTEGYNTLRSPSEVDTSTKKVVYPLHDIIFEVYADGKNPVSKAVYHYLSTKIIDGKKYYDSSLKIELQGYDAVSGVENIWYKLNSDTFAPYSETLASFKEGENKLTFYAVDNVGNIEEVHEEFFFIDKTPPKTYYEIEGNTSEKYVSANAVIKLTSDDNLSGVQGIFYRINTGSFLRYTAPIPVKLLSNDQASISYYSEDNMGNKETIQTIGGKNGNLKVEGDASGQNIVFEFYVDKDPPIVFLEINPDSFEGNYKYISPRSLFSIHAEDEKSGVDKMFYSVNTSRIETEYKEPFTIENKGLQYVRVQAVDYVGNSSVSVLQTFYCDPEPPKSTLNIGSPKFLSRDTIFVSSKTPFTISSKDEGAGVSSIRYAINKQQETEYKSSFNLETSGLTAIHFQATDKVNNTEEKNIAEIFVDNIPPVIHYHFSIESIGNKIVRDENYTIYPTNVMLYIAATDKYSGGEKIEYSINGGSLQAINPVKNFNSGNYLIEVNAYDVLGNKNTEVIKFSVEE